MKTRGVLILAAVLAAIGALGWWLLRDATLDVLQPAGNIAEQQRSLLIVASVLSTIVVVPVFTLLIVFSVRYREGNKKAIYDPNLTHNAKLEALWWGIPIVIIGVLGVITWQTSHTLDPYKRIASSNEVMNIEVVALQWKWLFLYPHQRVATVDKLIVPVDVPVEFSLTSDAPMSAFWVPSLGSQIYTMNGMTSKLNLIATEPGSYKGYNTNINGKGYASMDFTVEAVDKKTFVDWHGQLAKSSNGLDWATYRQLSKPSMLDSPKEYALHNTSLMHAIEMKFMPEHSMNGEME
ncbi:MAG TPA: ubiquinol oxidase subunit II [Candidatus Saccharibacteria bacterium]|nr:ubiquinol oxidase subunit II [Candidatus Saccharibacteria bacterium]